MKNGLKSPESLSKSSQKCQFYVTQERKLEKLFDLELFVRKNEALGDGAIKINRFRFFWKIQN